MQYLRDITDFKLSLNYIDWGCNLTEENYIRNSQLSKILKNNLKITKNQTYRVLELYKYITYH